MNDDTTPGKGDDALPHDHGDGRRCRATGMGRRARFGIAAAGLIGLGALIGTLAAVSGAVGAHGFGHRHGEHTLESITERALDGTAWVLGRVDATEAQEEQMNALVSGLVMELEPLRASHREHRRALLAELLRPEVDRGTLETLRVEELRLADVASTRILDAVAEAASILTPQQREQLLSRFDRHGGAH